MTYVFFYNVARFLEVLNKDFYNDMGFMVPGGVVEEKMVGNYTKDLHNLHDKSPA